MSNAQIWSAAINSKPIPSNYKLLRAQGQTLRFGGVGLGLASCSISTFQGVKIRFN